MADSDTWFLLVQFRRRGKTEVTEYADPQTAAAAYSEAERRYKDKLKGDNPSMDVLLVGASSIDVVKDRYPSYFTTAKSKADKIKDLLAGLPAVPA